MAYLIIIANGQELERRELTEPVCIGRSAECDISVHDVLLSRLHCRIEPFTETGKDGKQRKRWRIRDMGSRNGTHVNWQKVGQQTLHGGDQLRLGRTTIKFEAGEFVAAEKPPEAKRSRRVRPADPHEALMGTVSDFVLVEHDDDSEDYDAASSSPVHPVIALPAKPNRKSPVEADKGQPLHSSTVMTLASGKRRLQPQPKPRGANLPLKFSTPTDLSLQAQPAHLPIMEPLPQTRPPRTWHSLIHLALIGAAVCVATAAVLLSGWALTQ